MNTESKADANGWCINEMTCELVQPQEGVRVYIGDMFGEVQLNWEHTMYTAFDGKPLALDLFFKDWLHPTPEERTLFVLDGGFELPTDETLSKITRREHLYL